MGLTLISEETPENGRKYGLPTDVSFDKGMVFLHGSGNHKAGPRLPLANLQVAFAPSGDLFVSDDYGNATIHCLPGMGS